MKMSRRYIYSNQSTGVRVVFAVFERGSLSRGLGWVDVDIWFTS